MTIAFSMGFSLPFHTSRGPAKGLGSPWAPVPGGPLRASGKVKNMGENHGK